MTYTWGEIQIASIEKMYLNNTKIVPTDLPLMREDKKYKTYLAAMPSVANEGLLRLMSIGKPIVRKYALDNTMPEQITNRQTFEVHSITDDELVVSATGTKAYYFEVNNTCTVRVEEFTGTWDLIEEITHTATIPGQYTTYKKLVPNVANNMIRLVFEGEGYLYNVRNIAMYNINFRTNDEIIDNTKKKKYNLKSILPDMFKIVTIEYERNNENANKYDSDYILEGDNTLIIDSKLQGNFIITYEAYPDKITHETLDTYVFNTSSEMIALLPLYIASELYKDDDISIATLYRNQFETGLQTIDEIEEPTEFKSNSGWL